MIDRRGIALLDDQQARQAARHLRLRLGPDGRMKQEDAGVGRREGDVERLTLADRLLRQRRRAIKGVGNAHAAPMHRQGRIEFVGEAEVERVAELYAQHRPEGRLPEAEEIRLRRRVRQQAHGALAGGQHALLLRKRHPGSGRQRRGRGHHRPACDRHLARPVVCIIRLDKPSRARRVPCRPVTISARGHRRGGNR